MDILYTSACSSTATADFLLKTTQQFSGFQITKFSQLFLKGLIANGVTATVLSNMKISPREFWKQHDETEEGILYKYLRQTKLPVLRQISLFVSSFCHTIKWGLSGNKSEKLVLCDIFSTTTSMGCRTGAKMLGIPVCAIVTDMLGYSGTAPKNMPLWLKLIYALRGHFQQHSISKYDGYVFLTQYMNEAYNSHQRPHIVMEGTVDADFIAANSNPRKDKPRVIMYAGSIEKQYGLECLLQAFIQAALPDAELHLYGTGKFVEEVHAYTQQYHTIKYQGAVSNAEVVAAEQRATLLVNPRFSNQDFVKYSFPSKTTEYMVSGTPLLTTRLAGIPDEYFQYCYTFESETVDGFAQKLTEVLSLSDAELQAKGKSAQEFVLKYKNNIIQGARLKSFFQNILSAHR